MKGCVKVQLGRDWNDHRRGAVLFVDPFRAETLKALGYLSEEKEQAEDKASGTKSGRVSKSKK